MADSNITKKALAAALKQLMEETSFAEVSVSDICTACDMNRKSFYYHFKDKYDLVNWIFDTECLAAVQPVSEPWGLLERVCCYFYENRGFYRKVFKIEGQNSFMEHFQELLLSALQKQDGKLSEDPELQAFCIHFYVDAMICALMRWLQERDCMAPQVFASRMKLLIESSIINASQK